MRGNQKSVIDYFLVKDSTVPQVTSLVIDDDSFFGSFFSDHNWIKLKIKANPKLTPIPIKPRGWKINDDSPWALYQNQLNELITNWEDEMCFEGELFGDSQVGYSQLINILKIAGNLIIGKRPQPRKKKEPRAIRRAIKSRNIITRKWKRLCKASKIGTRGAWSSVLAANVMVKKLRLKHAAKISKRNQLKRARRANGNSKALWRS